ncbi:MAG: HEAT repeat domain-containing protein [Planctomycetaceae bacterium]|nr:HEAT repeat domain-containing protein [Planctomycetaceae bacterium]
MRQQKLQIITMIWLLVASVCVSGQNTVEPPVTDSALQNSSVAASTEETAARQIRLYREALLQGSTDVIRVDAAVALLLQNDASSRDVLISALKGEDNPPARFAVCNALIKSRGLGQTINARQDFLQPLTAVLQSKSSDQAKAAGEALLMFDYATIETPFRQLLANKEGDKKIRVQIVEALGLRPEPQALRLLIGLLDDTDPGVALAAETELQESFGVPVGTSRSVWADILDELQQKGPEEIRRERLLRQEAKLREVQAERDRWQKLFIASLDKQYETGDEAFKLKAIEQSMQSDLAALRLWSLDKIAKYPGGGEPFKAGLLGLLSDPSRDVRLQTAKVLTNMSALNPAEKLLERFKAEKDSELALAMFEALGEACFFAYSPGSGIELPIEIKMETLQIATDYLNKESPDHVKKGAEVVRKLLELNNLPEDVARNYLGALYQRYLKSKEKTPVLRADLLAVLAHLCGQGNLRNLAASMYEPLFSEAIVDKDNAVLRLSAARGLQYVDKSRAMELFRRLRLNADESLAVQQVVIETAGQAGEIQDLDWLITGLLNNVQGEQVWAAVKIICQRQSSDFLIQWIAALETAPGVTAEQIREVLEVAELKAQTESNLTILTQIRQRILGIFCQRGSWEQAAAYLAKLEYSEESFNFCEATKMDTLKVYLYSNKTDKAFQLFQSRLLTSDFDEKSDWSSVLQTYFTDENVAIENKRSLLARAALIQIQDRPGWTAFIETTKKALAPPVADTGAQEDPRGSEFVDG